mgnify:CR=1 FL=1
MKIKSNFNYLIIFLFFSFFLLGSIIFKDYSVTPDEPLHRINGFISLKYILNLFFTNLSNNNLLQDIPDLYNDWRRTYGSIFDLPFAYIEFVSEIDIQNIFLLKHYTLFVIYFLSTFYFFLLLKKNLKNDKIALIGVLILVSTPRIFSHSFYNSKDILFLSFMIIAVYYSVELLKKYSFKNLFISCILCAFASNIRIIGIYLPVLTFIFYFFIDEKIKAKTNIKFFFIYFSLFFVILYSIWPFLWLNPIENFLTILKESASYPNHWEFKTLYLGNYLNPENIPWHYFFIWFFSTTPLIFLLIIFNGLFLFLKKYLYFFLNIKFNKNLKIWENDDQMVNLFIFLCFFIPIFFVVTLNSTLYNGWRHLFFVYPFLIYISLFGLVHIFKKINTNFKKIFYLFIGLQILSNFYFIYTSHPIQNIYFNFVSKPFIKNNMPVDYWGSGNKKTIDFLITKNKSFSISTSSFTPLINLQYSDNKDNYAKNIKFFGTQKIYKNNSDYIFTNYYYNRNPKNEEKFQIPKSFISYYKLIINGITVNEVFAK